MFTSWKCARTFEVISGPSCVTNDLSVKDLQALVLLRHGVFLPRIPGRGQRRETRTCRGAGVLVGFGITTGSSKRVWSARDSAGFASSRRRETDLILLGLRFGLVAQAGVTIRVSVRHFWGKRSLPQVRLVFVTPSCFSDSFRQASFSTRGTRQGNFRFSHRIDGYVVDLLRILSQFRWNRFFLCYSALVSRSGSGPFTDLSVWLKNAGLCPIPVSRRPRDIGSRLLAERVLRF